MKTQLKFALLLTAVLLSACNKKVKEEPVDPNAGSNTSGQANTGDQGSAIVEEGAFGPSDLDSNTCLRQRVVYFDYDQDMLKPEYQAIVACHAKYLRDRPGARMRLEGHADERGTREYNMALGERRANAVKEFLVLQGVSGGLIEVISYGEERAASYGSNEGAWSLNRRVELK